MKKYKVLSAAITAFSICGLCAVNASAEETVTTEPVTTSAVETETVQTKTSATTTVTTVTSVSKTETVQTTVAETTTETVIDFGWKEDSNGKRYYISESGEKLTGYQQIDDKEYYFSANGTLKSGFYTINNVRMYFSPENYERQLGWVDYNDNRFYLDENGKTVGMRNIDNKDYIFDEYGACMVGWFEYEGHKYYSDYNKGLYKNACVIDDEKYYFSRKGKFISGWVTSSGVRIFYDYETTKPVYGWISYNGNLYYSDEVDGKCTGDRVIDGIKYRFDSNGCQQTGLQEFSDGKRYYDENGKPVSGFVTLNGSKYYFAEKTYLMQKGWQTIDGNKYYLDKNGVMQTGWQTIDSKKYYFSKNGIMQTGLQTIDGKKYYFDKNGVMQTGWQTIGGKKYFFDQNGVMEEGSWKISGGNKYYYDADGTMYKNAVYEIMNEHYYFDANGIMQTGWQKVGNDYYLFDRIDGKRQESNTIDGVTIDSSGKAELNDWSIKKIETMMTAHKIMLEQTNATDSMETKRLKCFNWVLSGHYHRYRLLERMYNEEGWEMTFANDVFKYRLGCCVSDASAVAFLLREIGYTNVAVCHDTSHAWAAVGKYIFDPVFAEAKSFANNYNAIPNDYRINPPYVRYIG